MEYGIVRSGNYLHTLGFEVDMIHGFSPLAALLTSTGEYCVHSVLILKSNSTETREWVCFILMRVCSDKNSLLVRVVLVQRD